MHIANIIALTILVIGNIYRCIRHTDTGLQTITVPLRLLAFFSVDTRPHEHLEHLLLHVLAQVVKCASGDAEEALGRRRRGRNAQVLDCRAMTLSAGKSISFSAHHSSGSWRTTCTACTGSTPVPIA